MLAVKSMSSSNSSFILTWWTLSFLNASRGSLLVRRFLQYCTDAFLIPEGWKINSLVFGSLLHLVHHSPFYSLLFDL